MHVDIVSMALDQQKAWLPGPSLRLLLLASHFPCNNCNACLLRPRCITLHFEVLNGICQASDQFSSCCRSCWSWSLSLVSLILPSSFVSSANLNTELTMSVSRSLMKMRNKTGPRTDPCGTPLVTNLHIEYWSLMHTRCFLPLNQLLIHSQTLPLIPWLATLSNSLMCGTLSNAFAKSRYI